MVMTAHVQAKLAKCSRQLRLQQNDRMTVNGCQMIPRLTLKPAVIWALLVITLCSVSELSGNSKGI